MLGGWVRQLSEKLTTLPEALHKEVIQCDYLQIDSSAGSQKEREDSSGLLYVGYHPSCSRSWLASYAGALQTDGYAIYRSAFGSNPKITLYECWAHARRYFYGIREIAPAKELAYQALKQIVGFMRWGVSIDSLRA